MLRSICWPALWLGIACAASAPPTRPTAGAGAYPGRCELVGIEYVEVPRRDEVEPGGLFLVARYRGNEAGPAPFDVRVRVEQRSAEELRAHLERNPIVACSAGAERSSVDLPAFEDGSRPVTEPD